MAFRNLTFDELMGMDYKLMALIAKHVVLTFFALPNSLFLSKSTAAVITEEPIMILVFLPY